VESGEGAKCFALALRFNPGQVRIANPSRRRGQSACRCDLYLSLSRNQCRIHRPMGKVGGGGSVSACMQSKSGHASGELSD
jgi:hypothetical protein